MSGETKADKRTRKACTRCKKRKKKCSGTLPCDYCMKIDEIQKCEYRTKPASKTVKVTEKYITSLKSRVRELEAMLAGNSSSSSNAGSFNYEMNPLIDSDEKEDELSPIGVTAATKGNEYEENNFTHDLDGCPTASEMFQRESDNCIRYSGDSACTKFLSKLNQSLLGTYNNELNQLEPRYKRISLRFDLEFKTVQNIFKRKLPPIAEAKRLLNVTSKFIGADYMYVEADYATVTIPNVIYRSSLPNGNEELLEYASHLARFFNYLSLGSLFDTEKKEKKFPGLIYFETALELHSELSKSYDRVTNESTIQSFLYLAYYSLSLDKRRLAYIMVGNAIRMVFMLGFHKKTTTTKQNRIFWMCFIYDRLISVRFGFPLMINEADINVPLFNEKSSDLQLTSLDIYHFNSQVKLARITTQIIRKIYTRNSFAFIQSCHTVLRQLKTWYDDLPPELKLDYDNITTTFIRPTFNLHINYNYSIIISTRPVILYVFNKLIINNTDLTQAFNPRQVHLISVLLESSVQAAKTQSLILSKLYYDEKMANSSFLDCHYIFSASIILIVVSFCQRFRNNLFNYKGDVEVLFERVQHNLEILQGISNYNIAAYNFNQQLTELIEIISSADTLSAFKSGQIVAADYKKSSPQQNLESQLENIPIEPSLLSDNNAFCDLTTLSNMDLSSVLSNMRGEFASDEESKFFDNDDFLKYSSILL